MKIVVYLTSALVVLISAFIIIFVSIPIGTGLSALGTLVVYDTWPAKILTAAGHAVTALLFAIPAYFIFTHARIRASWLCLVLVTPIIAFWLYVASSRSNLDMGSYAQALVWCGTFLFVIRKNAANIVL